MIMEIFKTIVGIINKISGISKETKNEVEVAADEENIEKRDSEDELKKKSNNEYKNILIGKNQAHLQQNHSLTR